MRRIIISLLMAAAFTLPVMAQEGSSVYVDLQVRGRGENRDGGLPNAGSETQDHSAFIQSRSRLVVGYQRPELEVKTAMQHSGVWGQADKGSFNIQEAWIRLNAPFGLFTKLGRQALSYDDERIIGPNDWNMAGNSHDILIAGFEGYGHKFHVGGAFNQSAENTNDGSTYYPGGSAPYKTMQLGWYHYDVPVVPLGASIMFMNIGMQAGTQGADEHVEWQHILGGYIKYSPQNLSVEASYYRQFGRNEDGIRLDAWMASGKAVYSPWQKLGFVAGYDYLSGDDTYAVPQPGQTGLIKHEVIKGFNPVYGSHHKFYGAMDFFYMSTYVNGFSPGLQNAYAGVKVTPMPGMDIGVQYHYLAIAAKLQDIGSTLGHEFEIDASWKFIKDVKLSLGLSYMVGTKNMQLLKRASQDGRLFWAWISIEATPRLLNYKW